MEEVLSGVFEFLSIYNFMKSAMNLKSSDVIVIIIASISAFMFNISMDFGDYSNI